MSASFRSFEDIDKQKPSKQRKKGGHRATLFVYAMEGLDNMAFVANQISLVTYFYGYMNFSLTKSATTFTNFAGTTYLLTLVGGFVSDTYLSRFATCLLFASMELVGYVLLALQASVPKLRPDHCYDIALRQTNQCDVATVGQETLFFIGLYLIAFGTSGIKAALPALGAEQYDEKDPKEAAQASSFFNWFLFSLVIGGMCGASFVVWLSANKGWKWSFGLCALAILISIVFLCMGKPFYRDGVVRRESPLLRILQVLVVAVKNWNAPLPENGDELHEIRDTEEGREIIPRTEQFRFLDRAAVIKRRVTGLETNSIKSYGPWSLCTVTQVEELKVLMRMMPVFLSTIFMNTCLAQILTFSVQQGTTMNSRIKDFEMPPSSIQLIPLFCMFVMIPLYDRIFVPLARKFTGIPTGIRHLQRIGIGLVLSTISMMIAGFIETRRKNIAIRHNMIDSNEPLPMTVFWLAFQFTLFGAADMFTLVGMLEFFYQESSANMKSLGTAISWCSFAFGFFTSTVVVEVVNKASGGWLASNNLNRDHLNYFYWLLSVLSFLNFVVYVTCATWYKYKAVEKTHGGDEESHCGGLSPVVPTHLDQTPPRFSDSNTRYSPVPLLPWNKK